MQPPTQYQGPGPVSPHPAGPSQAPAPSTASSFSLQLSTGKKYPLFREKKLLGKDIPELYPSTGDEAVAVVRQSPTDRNVLGLMNCSRTKWTVAMPDGSLREVESGKAVRLTEGMIITFGQTQARVQAAGASSAFVAQYGKLLGTGVAGLLLVVTLIFVMARGGGGPGNISSLVAKCDKSMISVKTADGSTGSAFFISSDGKALTNAHVVADDATVTVEFHDGQTKQAKVLAKDKKFDAALIQVEGGPYDALDIDYNEQPKGTPVMAIGFPKGSIVGSLDNSAVAHGLVSRYFDRKNTDPGAVGKWLQTDVSINHGNSGGPLINEESGKVVGINSAVINQDQKGEPIQGMGLAIPMFEVRDQFLNKVNQ